MESCSSYYYVPTTCKRKFQTVPKYLQHFAVTRPDDNAFVFVSTTGNRDVITWQELYEKSHKAALGLIHLGVQQQEIVAINLRTCAEFLYLMYGTMMAGAIPALVSFTYTDGSDVIAMMEKLCKCSLLAMDPGPDDCNWKVMNSLLLSHNVGGDVKSEQLPTLRRMLLYNTGTTVSNVKYLQDFMKEPFPNVALPAITENDIAFLLQTSGSTGVPKLVAIEHAAFLAFDEADINTTVYPEHGVYFNDRPFTWIGGMPLNVMKGYTRVVRSGTSPPPKDYLTYMIDVIERENVTVMLTLPPFIAALLDRKDQLPDNWSLQTIVTGGMPIAKHFATCIGKLCQHFAVVYGGTEFEMCCCTPVHSADDFVGFSCGTPVKGTEVKIVDDGGEVVPAGVSGEIYIRSASIFKEYFNDPQKTNAVKTSDGWYRTDDIGKMTGNGILFVEGRKSDVIISGGMNIAPAILEAVIKSCPGIANAALVPVPDSALYQAVCACVVLNPGSDATEEKIRQFCEDAHNDKAGVFTVLPKYYVILDKIPETNTGKISRKELSNLVANMFDS